MYIVYTLISHWFLLMSFPHTLVMLQPSDVPMVDKSKHKFMVQSMFAPGDFNADNLDQLVGGEENTPDHQFMHDQCVVSQL